MNVKIFLIVLVFLCVPIIGRTIYETNSAGELLGWDLPYKFCGRNFAKVLSTVCGESKLYSLKSKVPDHKTSIGGIAMECCINACTLNYLREYCVAD